MDVSRDQDGKGEPHPPKLTCYNTESLKYIETKKTKKVNLKESR